MPHLLSATTSRATPMMPIVRFRLQARTERLISLPTFWALVRKGAVPIHCFRVPNGCSTVDRRIVMAPGMLSRRFCMASSTASNSQRLIRRFLPFVQRAFRAQDGHELVQ